MNDPTAVYCMKCSAPLTVGLMLASKQIPNEEVSRLREEVNGLRKLIEAGTGIKVEYLREAYQKTIMEEANENPSEEPEK